MPGLSAIFGSRRGRLLKTGQLTQYSSELDDGYYRKGLAKAYTILTTGQYAGTANVDLIHYTAATISFGDPDTSCIYDSANGLAQFKTGDVIVITGSHYNNTTFTVGYGGQAGYVVVNETITVETAGYTVSIAKREAMSRNCVLDKNTGLMWLRYQPTKFGTASAGTMPWTGQLYDIFQFCIAVNVALLGGYSDWRVPNAFEATSLGVCESAVGAAKPNATAFPGWLGGVWTSTTAPESGQTAWALAAIPAGYGSPMGASQKTSAAFGILVRGG